MKTTSDIELAVLNHPLINDAGEFAQRYIQEQMWDLFGDDYVSAASNPAIARFLTEDREDNFIDPEVPDARERVFDDGVDDELFDEDERLADVLGMERVRGGPKAYGCDFSGTTDFIEYEDNDVYIPSSSYCAIKCILKAYNLEPTKDDFIGKGISPYKMSKQDIKKYIKSKGLVLEESPKFYYIIAGETERYEAADEKHLVCKNIENPSYGKAFGLIRIKEGNFHVVLIKNAKIMDSKRTKGTVKFIPPSEIIKRAKLGVDKKLTGSAIKIQEYKPPKVTKNICVFDIETYSAAYEKDDKIGNRLVPYGIAWMNVPIHKRIYEFPKYDSIKVHYGDNCVDEFLLTIADFYAQHNQEVHTDDKKQEDGSSEDNLTEKLTPIHIYAHNGGCFDTILLKNSKKLKFIDEIGSGSKIKSLTAEIVTTSGKKINLIFRDSINYLPMTLKDACKSFNIDTPKLDFDIVGKSKEWFDTNNCITHPELKCVVNENTEKNKIDWVTYLQFDVLSLSKVLYEFNLGIMKEFSIDINACLGSPGFALKLAKKNCNHFGNLYIAKDSVDRKFIRAAIHGGRVLHLKKEYNLADDVLEKQKDSAIKISEFTKKITAIHNPCVCVPDTVCECKKDSCICFTISDDPEEWKTEYLKTRIATITKWLRNMICKDLTDEEKEAIKINISKAMNEQIDNIRSTKKITEKITKLQSIIDKRGIRCKEYEKERKALYETMDGLICLDANSLYPSAMKMGTYPVGKPIVVNEGEASMLMLNEIIKKEYLYIAEVEYETCNQRYPVHPYRTKEGHLIYTNSPTGKKLVDVFTSVDIADMVHDGYKITGVRRIMYWTQRAKIFEHLMIELYGQRNKYKAAGNPMEQVIKIILNSLYGKMLECVKDTRYFQNNKVEDGTEEKKNITAQKGFPNGQWEIVKPLDRPTENNPTQIGAFILAYSRRIMNNAIRKIRPENIYYGDTDSIYTTLSAFRASGLKESSELGQFKNDYGSGSVIIKAYFLDIKRYLLVLLNEKGEYSYSAKFNGLYFPKGKEAMKKLAWLQTWKDGEILSYNDPVISNLLSMYKWFSENPKVANNTDAKNRKIIIDKWERHASQIVIVSEKEMKFQIDNTKRGVWEGNDWYPFNFDKTIPESKLSLESLDIFNPNLYLLPGIRLTPHRITAATPAVCDDITDAVTVETPKNFSDKFDGFYETKEGKVVKQVTRKRNSPDGEVATKEFYKLDKYGIKEKMEGDQEVIRLVLAMRTGTYCSPKISLSTLKKLEEKIHSMIAKLEQPGKKEPVEIEVEQLEEDVDNVCYSDVDD